MSLENTFHQTASESVRLRAEQTSLSPAPAAEPLPHLHADGPREGGGLCLCVTHRLTYQFLYLLSDLSAAYLPEEMEACPVCTAARPIVCWRTCVCVCTRRDTCFIPTKPSHIFPKSTTETTKVPPTQPTSVSIKCGLFSQPVV